MQLLRTNLRAGITDCVCPILLLRFVLSEPIICLMTLELYDSAFFFEVLVCVDFVRTLVGVGINGFVGFISSLCFYVQIASYAYYRLKVRPFFVQFCGLRSIVLHMCRREDS